MPLTTKGSIMTKTNVTIRMGAAYNDVTIKTPDKGTIVFDRRTMSKDENRNFHREFMNAFRAGRRA
jgi:hypothetical protein